MNKKKNLPCAQESTEVDCILEISNEKVKITNKEMGDALAVERSAVDDVIYC